MLTSKIPSMEDADKWDGVPNKLPLLQRVHGDARHRPSCRVNTKRPALRGLFRVAMAAAYFATTRTISRHLFE